MSSWKIIPFQKPFHKTAMSLTRLFCVKNALAIMTFSIIMYIYNDIIQKIRHKNINAKIISLQLIILFRNVKHFCIIEYNFSALVIALSHNNKHSFEISTLAINSGISASLYTKYWQLSAGGWSKRFKSSFRSNPHCPSKSSGIFVVRNTASSCKFVIATFVMPLKSSLHHFSSFAQFERVAARANLKARRARLLWRKAFENIVRERWSSKQEVAQSTYKPFDNPLTHRKIFRSINETSIGSEKWLPFIEVRERKQKVARRFSSPIVDMGSPRRLSDENFYPKLLSTS